MADRHNAVFLTCLLVALIGLRCHSESSTRDREFSEERLKEIVEESLTDEKSILGTIVRVDIEGRGTWEAATGYLDSSRTVPIAPDTRFLVGSIGKTFTAVLVLQLVEEGRLQLQDPLIEHLPPEWSAILDEIEYGHQMTVEQALRHRTGIADVTNSDEFWQSLVFDTARKWKPIDILEWVREEGEPRFEPGKRFDYCNTNYVLLGALVEHASGEPYREILKANILDAIGLDHTIPLDDTVGATGVPIARGYSTIDGELLHVDDVSVDWAMAEGALVSNAADLFEFFRSLRNGDLFDSGDTYRRMSERGQDESYALGLEITEDPDIGLYYGHRGSFLNTRAILAYLPEQRMTVTVCHTYTAFTMTAPEDLMKTVVQHILGLESAEEEEVSFEGPDLLAGVSNVRGNEDEPSRGEWDFDLKEEWSLEEIGGHPLTRPGNVVVGNDGRIYLLDRGTARVFVLGSSGKLLHSFGGLDDETRGGFPQEMWITADAVHVLSMGNTTDTITSYDRSGTPLEAYEIEPGISPRAFIDADRYVAVRSSSDVLRRPVNELLEVRSLTHAEGAVLGKFPAEDKMILTSILPRGRYILLENDVELFPRLIIHLAGGALFVGRSDRYLIRKIDLEGHEQLVFSMSGRVRRPLPSQYASDRADRKRIAGDKEMPDETRERFVAEFPQRQTFFTQVTTDDRGLVYVFIPDILDPTRRGIDIFSSEGEYLYRAVIELPDGTLRFSSIAFDRDHLMAVVESEQGTRRLVRYGIRWPEVPGR